MYSNKTFFNDIERYYGNKIRNIVNKYIINKIKINKRELDIKFITTVVNNNTTPRFTHNKSTITDPNAQKSLQYYSADLNKKQHQKKIKELEIKAKQQYDTLNWLLLPTEYYELEQIIKIKIQNQTESTTIRHNKQYSRLNINVKIQSILESSVSKGIREL